MAFVPKYLGNVDTDVRTGVTLFTDAQNAEALPKASELKAVLDDIHELDQMPIASKNGVVWDLNVTVRSSAPLSRLISLNHPIAVQFADNKTVANVQLAASVDKKRVPCKDFVLRFRDKAINDQQPTALKIVGQSGH